MLRLSHSVDFATPLSDLTAALQPVAAALQLALTGSGNVGSPSGEIQVMFVGSSEAGYSYRDKVVQYAMSAGVYIRGLRDDAELAVSVTAAVAAIQAMPPYQLGSLTTSWAGPVDSVRSCAIEFVLQYLAPYQDTEGATVE